MEVKIIIQYPFQKKEMISTIHIPKEFLEYHDIKSSDDLVDFLYSEKDIYYEFDETVFE